LADLVIGRGAAPALSVSGGEPLDQYESLCLFLKALKDAGFSVLMWTGFEMNEVESDFSRILHWLDYIIVGPYFEHKRTPSVPFVSSSNQEVFCLTPQAKTAFENYSYEGEYEVVIPKGGSTVVSLGGDLENPPLQRQPQAE
jgi:anaerobic ribonucleoside-triphosphate reductase activating protein